jgi:ABC-type enterobactin transport system permease subunit
VAGNEPVTSPDQHKPSNVKAARIGGVVTIILLLLMLIGNHRGRVENLWLIGIAAVIAALLVGDWLMRKNGLNSDD